MAVGGSPFPYQGPLQPAEVLGRDALIADLVRRVTRRKVTALVGPRRYGKTSVLRRLSAELRELSTLWVDLYEVSSLADVAVRFDRALGTGDDVWADGLSQLRVQTADAIERMFSDHSLGERRVLRSLAASGTIFGARAELLDLAKSTAQSARQALLDTGDLADGPDGLRIVDPVLADWIRNRFPL